MFAGSPSTYSCAPTENRSGASLPCSTKNAPLMPCGLPTRPTVTRSDKRLEVRDRLRARGSRAQVLVGEFVGVRPAGRANLGDRALDVERRLAELHVLADDRPERCDLAFVRHADRAGVDEALAPELHVRVTGDYESCIDAVERGVETLLRRSLREDRHVVVR